MTAATAFQAHLANGPGNGAKRNVLAPFPGSFGKWAWKPGNEAGVAEFNTCYCGDDVPHK